MAAAPASPRAREEPGFAALPPVAPPLLPPPGMAAGRRRRGGFTLIELLVVVAILGILAAIAIPSFASRQGKAFDARVVNDVRAAANGEEAYFVDQAEYFTGECSGLPGVNLSEGVECTATAEGLHFSISASHPRATRRCTWSTLTTPNLICVGS